MTIKSTIAKLRAKKRTSKTESSEGEQNERKKVKQHNEGIYSTYWDKYFNTIDVNHTRNFSKILQHFDDCLERFDNLKTKSDDLLKGLLEPFALYKKDSPLYVYTDEEQNPSCKKVSCAFGPTFPPNKYALHHKKLDETGHGRTILILSEAPGTGKTNIAYHLTKTPDQLVLLVTLSLTNLLESYLQKVKSREHMDSLASIFFSNYMAFGCILYEHAKSRCTNPGTAILRFLFNEGSVLIGKCETFLQELNPKNCREMKVYFMMDEVQLFNLPPLSVPRNTSKDCGNAITLYSSAIRRLAPLIMTTTYFKSIEPQVEKLVSNTTNLKETSLVYSYHFPHPLPVVHCSQVVPFLKQFINIEENEYDEIWRNVSYFIQGPFRRCEQFLQYLITRLETSLYDLQYHELIYSILDDVLVSYSEEVLETTKALNQLISTSFHELAIFGEAKLTAIQNFSKYLLTNSISYTFDCTHHLFQVLSPLDQQVLFNTLKLLADKSGIDWLTYSFQNINRYINGAKFCEIILVYYLLNHSNDILAEFSGSYLEEYLLKATYYVKDIQVSNKASNLVDIRGSSLMINAMNPAQSNSSIMRKGQSDITFSEMLIIPNTDAGPDLLGVLVESRGDPVVPFHIPLISATSLKNDMNKLVEDYKSTNPQNMYSQNIAMQNNQPIQDERENIREAVSTIMSNGKMLRLLFHPNTNFSSSLEERIPEYSSNEDVCCKAFSRHAVLTDKGHLIYEISGCNPKWQEFVKNFHWLDKFLNL